MTKTDRAGPGDGDQQRAAYGKADLLDSPPEEAFDRVTRLVARLLDVPVSLVTILDEDRQFFKGEIGLPEPWHSARQTPLSHSFCQHVVRTGAPLVIDDARADPLVCDNLAIRDLGVEAYLGYPLRQADGKVIGSLCAIDSRVHIWSQTDRSILADLAGIVETELFLRNEIRRREAAEVARTLLMREMEHRVKNSFAKVQAIVSLSLREGGDAAVIRKSVTQRIAALARTQSLLTDVGARGTTVGDILANELSHYEATGALVCDSGRLDISGEPVPVTEEEAASIGMVAHELATNAAKYGAIAKGGSIAVSWQATATASGRRLRLEWRETGIAIEEEPSRTGFGSTLLETLVVRQHGGSIDRAWLPSGLVLVAELDLVG
ncbi:GAF domain-containing protein [Aureimonas sp. Leaf454]|uniref:sensor histidine kinase n=1 Tax=Aureimonas sp. Leaf454 TaxID=1736381 RepID=UPI000AC7FF6F|nr:GAF domain-containing protein [Aureimonas sp. Leaf454]